MIGKYQYQIGAEQFAQGLATSDYTNDGGMGTTSFNINPIRTKGVLFPTSTADISTNVTGTLIATCEDSQSVSAYDRLMVDDEGGYYTFNGVTITKTNTGAATTKYTFGFTDMASFGFNTYVTLRDNIAQWNTSGSPALDETWWTGTKGQAALTAGYPHPLLVYEGNLWVADTNLLIQMTSGGTVSTQLTLASNERIQALGIDPGTGLMLISVQVTQNYSDALSTKSFIYLHDGYSSKPRRKIPVEEVVLSFVTSGGTVFCGYGLNIGYFNGSGVTFLRALTSASLATGADLPYKHHLTAGRNFLYVVDGVNVVAYGDILNGKKVWFPLYQNQVNSSHFGAIGITGGNTNVMAGFSTDKVYLIQPTNTTAAAASYYSPNTNFARPVYIRRVRIITTGIATTSGSGIGGCAVIDEGGTANQAPGALGTFVNLLGSNRFVFDFDFTSLKLQMAQLRLNFNTQSFGFVRAIVYYDPAE